MKKFSHLDAEGRAKMVDVGHKPAQLRIAVAEGFVTLPTENDRGVARKKIAQRRCFHRGQNRRDPGGQARG